MDDLKRFYLFTGKGGVGKTTLALSFCKFLEQNQKKYLYLYLSNSKINKPSESHLNTDDLAKELGLNVLSLNLQECAKGYITKKLKSETIAKWVVKTPFFQSLINMIPGFSYVIYLGQILEMLIDDPQLTIVLDSPSSGHALTMLEATKNFNHIFESGVVYQDTKLMLETLEQKDFTKINIITLPTLLAVHEATELEKDIKTLSNYQTDIYCNNCLNSYQDEALPDFLKEKIYNEQEALKALAPRTPKQIPYCMNNDSAQIVKDLVPSVENLV